MAVNNSKPLYIAIYNDIRDRIVSGDMTPGDLLPSENEFSAQYCVSRVTIRQSLKHLENEGLIFSRPKRGYFVNSPQMTNFSVPFYKDLDDYRVLLKDVTVDNPNEEIQQALGVSSQQKIIILPKVRIDKDFAFSYEIVYSRYSKGYPSIEASIDFAAYPELTYPKVTPFAYYTEMEMSVTAATDDIQKVLNCPEGEPLMLIRRYIVKQSGERSVYIETYMRSPYDKLKGVSGYRVN